MINIKTNFIESGRELTSSEYRGVIKKFIQYLTEISRDKDLLDEQTVDQIIDLTYKYNTSLNATYFSNNLMPRDLYDKLKYTTWRLHSSEKVTFLVELPDDADSIKMTMFAELFFPQLFRLKKKINRKKKAKFEEVKEEDKLEGEENVEENELIEADKETDDVGDTGLLEIYDDFEFLEEVDASSQEIRQTKVFEENPIESREEKKESDRGGPYEFEYKEEKYLIDDPITGPLRYINLQLDFDIDISNLNDSNDQIKESITINENIRDQTKVLEEYGDYDLKLYTLRENVFFKVEVKRIDSTTSIIEMLGNKKIYQVGVTLKNVKESGKTSQRLLIFQRSLICPLIRIEVIRGNIIEYVQKLQDLIKSFSLTENDQQIFYDKQKLIKSFTRQVSCVLTFREKNLLCISPFGIFDQLKYSYKEIEMDDTFDDLIKFKQKIYKDGGFSKDEINFLEGNNTAFYNISYIKLIHLVFFVIKTYLKPPPSKSNPNPKLRSFQWVNTIWRIKYLIKKLKFREEVDDQFFKYDKNQIDRDTLRNNLNDLLDKYKSKARIVKAPTGAGKTLIFFIDALLHYFFTTERCVIIFPTRLLNLEMFQNLTTVIYLINEELKKLVKSHEKLTAGLYIGQFQYNLRTTSKGANKFPLIPKCPECKSTLTFERNSNDIPECSKCHHQLDYIYTPYKNEINYFIPDFLVATPDKIFWDLFVDWRVASRFGNFGTLVVKCPSCKKYTSFLNKSQNKDFKSSQRFTKCMNSACQHQIPLSPDKIKRKLIGFIILDEIHSISGLTGIFLSKLLKSLKFMQKKYLGLREGWKFNIEIESGTATIAEEESFVRKLVEKKPSPFPKEDRNYHEHFQLLPNEVRYRILVLNNVFTALRRVFTYANLYSFKHYCYDKDYDLLITAAKYKPDLLRLGCGYVYRKDDGYSTKGTITRFGNTVIPLNVAARHLNPAKIFFISGNSEQTEIITFLKEIESNNIEIFIANQVVSLGLNIKGLNRIILLGTPKSVNEQVQTVGRIGRADIPGFATILLYPNVPRDDYLYENFHFYFLNCSKFYEPNPIQNFNLFISEVLTPNLFLLYVKTELEKDYLLKQQTFSTNYWLTTTNENQRMITKFILNILSGSNIFSGPDEEEEFKREHKEAIFAKIRQVLKSVENAVKRAGRFEFLNQILDRNGLIVTSMRKDSGQVGITIREDNPNFKKW